MPRKKKENENDEKIYNVNFDYKKMANEIVNSYRLMENSNKKNEKIRTYIMNFLNGIFYFIWMYLGCYYVWNNISELYFKIPLFCFMAIVLFLCQQESLGDDYKTTKEHFNNTVSVTALIIALISLFK